MSRRWTGRLTAGLTCLFLAFQGHACVALMVPWFGREPTVQLVLQCLAALAILNVFIDYVRVWSTCPGYPEASKDTQQGRGDSDAPHEAWCSICKADKPERAHHCSACGRCVLKMDHHCVFVDNCIGLHNYRLFLYLLFDALCVASFQVFGLLPQVFQIVVQRLIRYVDVEMAEMKRPDILPQLHVIAAFLSASLTLWMVGTLLFAHVQQVLCNSTTIEEMAQASIIAPRQCGPYDRGALENFAEVFGRPPRWCQSVLGWSLGCARFWLADMEDELHCKHNTAGSTI